MLAVWGGVVFTVSVASMLKNLDLFRADPRQLVTLPPLPGVLFVVGLATAYVIRMLRPGRHLGLRRLRAVEWFSVAMLAGFCVLNQTLTLFAGTAFENLVVRPGEVRDLGNIRTKPPSDVRGK